MKEVIGTPTVSGMKGAAIDFGVGLGGGLLFSLSQALTGSGLVGGLVGAALAGSVIKGTRGQIIATVLGFQTLASGASAPKQETAPAAEVM